MNTCTRNLRARLRVSALASSMALTGLASADNSASVAASVTSFSGTATHAVADESVERRVSAELRVVMAELIESGAFGEQPAERIALDIDTPAQRVSDLGVLVDSAQTSANGLRVLAVTPGGNAERTGVRADDVLVAVNGVSLAGGGSASLLRRTVDSLPDGSALAFQVARGGNAHMLSGTLSSVYLPAMHLTVGEGVQVASNARASTAARDDTAMTQGCGRISEFDVAPRQQDLHGARIILIDGVTPGPSGSRSYRVGVGSHVLQVAELIESRYLPFSDIARYATVSANRYKTLTVEVAANTTTLIAARLNQEQRNEPANGVYWDPVAWKQVAEACH